MRGAGPAIECLEALMLGELRDGDRDARAGVQWLVGKVLRIEGILVAISQGKAVKE